MSTGKGSKEFKWTGDAHEALAAALARMHGTIKSDQQAALVKDMNDNGFCTSWEGIRQHLQKLKKKDASAPSTPAKPAGAAKQKKPTGSTGKKRTHQVAADVDVDVDEDEYDKPDVKKLKVKMEPLGYDPVHLDDDDDDGEV